MLEVVKNFSFSYYFIGAVVLFLVWYMISLLFASPIIPSPIAVSEVLCHIFINTIFIHVSYSMLRIVCGLCFAIIIGLPLGLAMGYFPQIDRLLSPIVYLTYPIPKIALLPILMLLCGVGDLSKILMIFLIIVFQVVVAVRDGIKSIPTETFFPLLSLGASFYSILREVLWPAALPRFLTAIRIALATAISVLFFTETFGTRYGLGYFIMDAWMRVNYLDMYAGIVVLSFMGLFLFALVDFLENYTCKWQIKQ